MTFRRALSMGSFAMASGLLLGAIAILVTARALPSEGMQDLGRIATAIVLAALSSVAFVVALVAGRKTRIPRWATALSWLGAAIGGLAVALLLAVRLQ